MNCPIPCRRHDAAIEGIGCVLSETANHVSMTSVSLSASSKDTDFGAVAGDLDPVVLKSSSASSGHTQRYDAADTT